MSNARLLSILPNFTEKLDLPDAASASTRFVPEEVGSIRTLGPAGTEYRRKLASEADRPGDLVTADGSRWGLVGRELSIEVFGAVGDGSTDDTEAFDKARQYYEIVGGGTLRLQEDATYLIDGWDLLNVKDLKIVANGASFVDRTGATSGVFLRLGERCELDHFRYTLPVGLSRYRVLRLSGANSSVDTWDIRAVDQQNNRANLDGAVLAYGTSARLGSGKVVNFDNAYIISGSGIQATRLEFESYCRGVWFDSASLYTIGAIIGRVASANSEYAPGVNGALISGTEYGLISRIDVEDAGEHGVRVGGGNGGNRDVHIEYLRAHNSGGCGLKLRPGEGEYNRRITFGTVELSDSGIGPEWGPNEDGMLVERVMDCRVGYLHVFAVNKAQSCSHGLHIANADGFTVGDALIRSCEDGGIYLNNNDGFGDQDLNQIRVKASVVNCGANGVTILTNNILLRAIYLDVAVRHAGAWAMRMVGSGTVQSQCHFTIRSFDHSSGMLDVPTTIGGLARCKWDLMDETSVVTYVPSDNPSAFLAVFRSDAGGKYSLAARVMGNGDLQNANNSYGGISDARLKDSVEASGSQWDDIKALQVRKFINRLNGEEQIGLVAQEVEQVSPGLISLGDTEDTTKLLREAYPEASEEEIESLANQGPLAALKYSVLNLKLLKVVQELQERVETLEGTSS